MVGEGRMQRDRSRQEELKDCKKRRVGEGEEGAWIGLEESWRK